MRRKVNISDIARESGVSVSTVSLVLNDKPGVSQETRARVLEAAGLLGYLIQAPSRPGRNPALATIGMVVKSDPDIPPSANPFYSKIIMGIEDACRRRGVNLLFATLPVDDDNLPLEIPQLLYHELVDGLLLVGVSVDEAFRAAASKRPLPVVLVDGYAAPALYDSVVSDNFRAAFEAVEYLIRKGHRRIGMLGGDSSCFPSLRDRRNGYLRALKENDIAETYLAGVNINRSHGYQEALAFLREHPEVTALFCINDDVGSAALRAAYELGRRAPDDLSIVGYDDTYIAANTHPGLTTMHVDTVAMGRAAVYLLALRAEYPESARMSLVVHPALVERASSGQAPSPLKKQD